MFTLKNTLIFLAGAEFFHTLCHALLPLFVKLPAELTRITLSPALNMWAAIVNGIITIALLWWASRVK